MATIEEQVPQTELARGALTLFDTLSSTLANLAPVEGIFLSITLVVFAMGSMASANVFWAWILAIVLVAAVATVIIYMRRPGALQRAVASGPEYIVSDAPGGVPEGPGRVPEGPGR